MELGNLLVLAKLITVEQLNDALERQTGRSGRLGDHLVATGAIGKQASRLNALTEEIIRIEERADQLHDQGRKELYSNQANAFAFMIGTEVYDHLEKVVDRFEDVANEISAIVIENV